MFRIAKKICAFGFVCFSPALLEKLSQSTESVDVHLEKKKAANSDLKEVAVDEKVFRWQMNEDEMATDKLSEGIRKFAADAIKLEDLLRKRLAK